MYKNLSIFPPKYCKNSQNPPPAKYKFCPPAKSKNSQIWRKNSTCGNTDPKSSVQVTEVCFILWRLFVLSKTLLCAAFGALLTTTDHNAKSNPKLAEAIRNLGAVSGVGRGTPRFTVAFVIDQNLNKRAVIELLCWKVLFATSMIRLEVQRVWIGCCDMIICTIQASFTTVP